MQKSLHIDANKCTGCLQCEMACSYDNHGIFNISKSRIKVFTFEHEGRNVPYTCTQCAVAWCLNACPVDAIRIDLSTGAKVGAIALHHHTACAAVRLDSFKRRAQFPPHCA